MNPLEWLEQLPPWLIRRAACLAPQYLSQRLQEEWLADLAQRGGLLARLRFGLACCWATSVIAHDLGAAGVAATASGARHKALIVATNYDYGFLSRRTLSLLLIACLHVLVIYGFVIGAARKAVVVPPNMVGSMLELPHASQAPPPPVNAPAFAPTRLHIPQPQLPLDARPDLDGINDVNVQPIEPRLPPASASATVQRTVGGPGLHFPNTDDYYPSSARRLGQKGTATVQVCVDERGKLTAAPSIADSSGTASIDEGALKLARAGSGHYRATTENGLPVGSCFEFRVRFELRE